MDLISLGYKLEPAPLKFEFGDLPSFEVLNYDDKYEDQSKAFLNSLPEENLPAPYENFKRDFLKLQQVAPKDSSRFRKFEKMLKAAACKKQRIEPEKLEALSTKIKVMMKKFDDADQELESIEKSIESFFKKFPREVPETCDDEYKMHTENKVSVIEALQWTCKQS